MGVPRMTVTYTLHTPLNRPRTALLVVGGAHQSHQDPQDYAQDQGQSSGGEGGPDPVQILFPAVGLNKGHIELHIKFLPPGDGVCNSRVSGEHHPAP